MNSTEILTKLPEVFDLRDLQIATGVDRKHASQMCWRWSKKSFVSAFSEGVYFNLIADRKAPSKFVGTAINKVSSSYKLVIGVNSLNAAGWTTQMPRIIELAVPVDRNHRTFKQMEGVVIAPRSLDWFRKVLPVSKDRGAADQLMIPAAYALVDSFMDGLAATKTTAGASIWHPDPDDISISGDIEKALQDILEAAEVLDAPLDELHDYLSGIEELCDILPPRNTFSI